MSSTEIPGFQIIEKLGQGGMATVWKAKQLSLDRIVAIKILSSQFAHDPADVLMFQKEAQSAAKLKHPGIVQVYDANALEGTYYFVMEYVAGYTVGDWIRRKGVLPEKDALLVAECVADALEYAWDNQKIIHCDIKPDNVIVDSDGTVKLADLGLAKTLSAMTGDEAEEEDVMGTPAYISPEQACGDPEIDFRADIYSLGAMLYHLMTGTLLFEGHEEDVIMEMQVKDTVPDPMEVNPDVSKPMAWLIEKMLCKEKEGRESNWGAVRDDLARVKRGRMPRGHVPPEGASTVRRSAERTSQDYVKVPKPLSVDAPSSKSKIVVALVTCVVVLCVALLVGLAASKKKKARGRPPPAGGAGRQNPGGRPGGGSSQRVTEKSAREMFEFVGRWAKSNPVEFDAIAARYRKVAKQTSGTKYALMAEDEIKNILKRKERQIADVLRTLSRQAKPLVDEGSLTLAAEVFTDYDGEFAALTRPERTAKANELVSRHDALVLAQEEREKRVQRKTTEAYHGVAKRLTEAGVGAASDFLADRLKDQDLTAFATDFEEIQSILEGARNMDGTVMDSFKESVDKKIKVNLLDGSKTILVDRVVDGTVYGEERRQSGARFISIPVSFSYDKLSVRERLDRMGDDKNPDVALVKGLMALSSGAYGHASRYFERLPARLAKPLAEELKVLDDEL